MQAFKITDVKRVHIDNEKARAKRMDNKAHNKHLNHFKAV
jgi:hypothetical protein